MRLHPTRSSPRFADARNMLDSAFSTENNQVISACIQSIYDSFRSHPLFTSRAPDLFVVGGTVRDMVLSHKSNDLDLELFSLSSEDAERVLKDTFGKKAIKQGKAFPVYKLLLNENLEVELTVSEKKIDRSCLGRSLENALCRRDFTFNAMALDVTTGQIHDPFGGMNDLVSGMLKAINPKELNQFPVRILRGMQLYARLELTSIENETLRHMQDSTNFPSDIHHINLQFRKLFLLAEKPSLGLEYLRQTGLLRQYLPAVDALIGTPQDPRWHKEGDVWNHTMLVIDQAARSIRSLDYLDNNQKLAIMLAALLHDIGKPLTTEIKGDAITAHKHEIVGAKLSKDVLAGLGFSASFSHLVMKLVKNHMMPMQASVGLSRGAVSQAAYDNMVRKCVKAVYPATLDMFCSLLEADKAGRMMSADNLEDIDHISRFRDTAIRNGYHLQPQKTLINSKQLSELGFESAEFKNIIMHIEKLRDNGNLTNTGQALAYVKRQYLIRKADYDALGFRQPEHIKALMLNFKQAIKSGLIQTRQEALKWLRNQEFS